MMLVRPVAMTDIDALVQLAADAISGVHTLPKSVEAITRAVQQSIDSFVAFVDLPSDASYTFVLEDSATGKLLGTAAISARAGTNGPFFAFRNDVMQQVSRDLNISHSVHTLTLCSGLTGYSQLSRFYVATHDRRLAVLLSRARLMFAALAPHRFSDRFFVSLAGVTDADGHSPFWEALGRKFFQMDFLQAKRLIDGARNRSLIVELMPHYPVYVPLLPSDAQAVMGQVHADDQLLMQILSEEGFEPDEFIDIFDGGPILQAHCRALRAFSASLTRRAVASAQSGGADHYVVCNTDQNNFRAVLVDASALDTSDDIGLSPQLLYSLQIAVGDAVHCVKS